MNHEDVVVVVSLAIVSEIFASGLYNDDIASIDYPSGNGGSLNKNTIQRAEYLINDGLLANKLTAPGAFAYGAPDDFVAASLPEGRAIASGNLLKDGGDELCVGREITHGAEPFLMGLGDAIEVAREANAKLRGARFHRASFLSALLDIDAKTKAMTLEIQRLIEGMCTIAF